MLPIAYAAAISVAEAEAEADAEEFKETARVRPPRRE